MRTRTIKKEIIPYIVCAGLFALAGILQYIDNEVTIFWDKLLSLVINLIFFLLIFIWGNSAKNRIVEKSTRRLLITVATLMFMWLLLRYVKYYFFASYETASRYLWYLYYIPQCLVPPLAWIAAMGLTRKSIVLMDVVTADGANGLDAAEKIKKNDPSIKIVIVTSMPECSYISRAKALGAEGFWYKETGKESLISVMDRVMQGEIVYPEGLQVVNIGVAKSNEFTEKELRVLRLMTGGYSNQEIADKLGVSLNAVKKHISNMLEKTCLRSRTELAVKARETGLVILENTDEDI